MRALSKELQEKAEKELNEKPDQIMEDIDYLKKWIEKEPHLNARTDDQWLLGFLRESKFSLQRTKEKIDLYYTVRTLLPEFFKNRDPFSPEIQYILNLGLLLPLPKPKSVAGPRIILFHWTGCDSNLVSFNSLTKLYFMLMDILINEDDHCMISGLQVFSDATNMSLSYVSQFTPSYTNKIAICVQTAYPIKIDGMHFYNIATVFETAFNLLKTFMSEKFRDSLFFYTKDKLDTIYEQIPQELLCKEYGGNNGSIAELKSEWKKKIESYKSWFEEDENYGTHEHLRYGKPYTSADMFGTEGTFRKLTVD